jgi:hypothetical protein
MDIVVAVALIVIGIIGVVAVSCRIGGSPRALFDRSVCGECGVKMLPDGYIAHGFQRHYICPLCNRDEYIVDPVLKQQKIDTVVREHPEWQPR